MSDTSEDQMHLTIVLVLNKLSFLPLQLSRLSPSFILPFLLPLSTEPYHIFGISPVNKPNSSSHISVPLVILVSLLCTSSSLD